MSLGFQEAGLAVVAAFDAWDVAVTCYKANFSHEIEKLDLADVQAAAERIRGLSPDIIIGGPPCQEFSHAGSRTEGSRADLTESFARIVTDVRPTWFVMENVARVRNSNAYSRARAILKAAGYGLTETVLDASLCGVPQKRKRFFCIGKHGAEDGFLETTIQSSLAPRPMTIRDYLGDELGIEHYYRHPRNYNRRGIYSIDEPSATVRGVNRPVPAGYPGHRADSTAKTESLRPLTTMERARIQTFPRDFRWAGSKTDIEQLIGNAVPVRLAAFVATAIAEYES